MCFFKLRCPVKQRLVFWRPVYFAVYITDRDTNQDREKYRWRGTEIPQVVQKRFWTIDGPTDRHVRWHDKRRRQSVLVFHDTHTKKNHSFIENGLAIAEIVCVPLNYWRHGQGQLGGVCVPARRDWTLVLDVGNRAKNKLNGFSWKT